MNELKRNGSGYTDPTAYKALRNCIGGANVDVYRGDVFFTRGYKPKSGSEITQDRPCVIVSNDTGNKHSSVVEVVFLTSKEKSLPTHVDVLCKIPSIALCEQVNSISKTRLAEYVRSCTNEEMERIDEALRVSLALEQAGESDLVENLKNQLEEISKAYTFEGKKNIELQEKNTSLFADLGELQGECIKLKNKLESALVKNEELKAEMQKASGGSGETVFLKAQISILQEQNERLIDRLCGK